MKKRGKKYLSVSKIIDKSKLYSVKEAISLIKKNCTVKFDATFECSFRMHFSSKKTDQNIRGVIILPHGVGKVLKVAVVTQDLSEQTVASESGADYVGGQELIQKISQNWLDFDILVSSPAMMPYLAKLGRILGPKGLMPNPKTETVTNDIAKAVKEIKNGKIEYRSDKSGNLNLMIGKVSFSEQQILENFQVFYENLLLFRQKIKGLNIKNLVFSNTMSPGVKVNLAI